MGKLIWLVVLFSLMGMAHAADPQGQFAVRGVGLLDCASFSQHHQSADAEYQMIGGWLDGFLTGANASLAGTYDVMAYESTELVAEVINNHCLNNPEHRLFEVLTSIVRQKLPHRLQASSPLRRITVGDMETYLHAETLQRMQARLVAGGLLEAAAVSDEFTVAIRTAVQQFQATKNFAATGFPDQATLWLLFDS